MRKDLELCLMLSVENHPGQRILVTSNVRTFSHAKEVSGPI